ISAPATDCSASIGEPLILKGLHQQVPGEFFCASTRPPAVYRGNPFLIEVGLAYGGASPTQKVTLETLTELLAESDARSLRQFLLTTFDGIGRAGAEKILSEAKMGPRQTPSRIKKEDIAQLHAAMKNVNLTEGQTMQVLRYANRVPLQFQPAACAITQAVISNNWRAYGLSQSRGQIPVGPVTVMVHMASVWVPFTSESKEATAADAATSTAKDKKTLTSSRGLADGVVKSAESGRAPHVENPARSLSNVRFNQSKRMIEMGSGTNRRELFNLAQARSYMQTLLVGSG